MKKMVTLSVFAAILAAYAAPAFAHHGTAAYDDAKTMVLNGTVEKFEFVNPHILTHIAVTAKNGQVQHWLVETEPPSLALRDGWAKDMMKPGDHISWEVRAAKNGAPVARGGTVVTVNGTKRGQEIQPETVTIPAVVK